MANKSEGFPVKQKVIENGVVALNRILSGRYKAMDIDSYYDAIDEINRMSPEDKKGWYYQNLLSYKSQVKKAALKFQDKSVKDAAPLDTVVAYDRGRAIMIHANAKKNAPVRDAKISESLIKAGETALHNSEYKCSEEKMNSLKRQMETHKQDRIRIKTLYKEGIDFLNSIKKGGYGFNESVKFLRIKNEMYRIARTPEEFKLADDLVKEQEMLKSKNFEDSAAIIQDAESTSSKALAAYNEGMMAIKNAEKEGNPNRDFYSKLNIVKARLEDIVKTGGLNGDKLLLKKFMEKFQSLTSPVKSGLEGVHWRKGSYSHDI